MKRIVEKYFMDKTDTCFRVLDVGSYDCNGTYKKIFSGMNFIYNGMDINKGPNVDIVCYNSYDWSNISDNSYDLVISGQCLEHVPMPWVWIREVSRVCVPGGYVVLIAPWRAPYHKAPVDCWRILPDGAEALLKWGNLVPVEITMERHAETLDDTEQSGKSWGDDTIITARKP
jgi:SAM-dependent methyltransferase